MQHSNMKYFVAFNKDIYEEYLIEMENVYAIML